MDQKYKKKSSRWRQINKKNKIDRKNKRRYNRKSKKTTKENLTEYDLKLDFFEIYAPNKLSIYNAELNEFVQSFVENIINLYKQKNIRINFSKCEQITAPCILILFSTIQELLSNPSKNKIRITFKNSIQSTKDNLLRSGILDLINNNKQDEIRDVNGYLPVIHRDRDFGVHNKLTDYLISNVFKDINTEQERILSDAISETILNISQHAYGYQTNEKVQKHWWTTLEIIDDNLYLAIYDKGLSIPSTILNTDKPKKFINSLDILGLATGSDDPHIINAAMKYGRSATKQHQRGQGSKSIQTLVDSNDGGVLWVASRKGLYKRTGGKDSIERLISPIIGTLIQWNIKISNSIEMSSNELS